MNIVTHRHEVVTITQRHEYECRDGHGGFGFDVDADGHIVITDGNRANVEHCLTSGEVIDRGIVTHRRVYMAPAEGRCDCGALVVLEGFTNTCDGCGADYNSGGQRLAPRSQWGEETGETAADILRGGDPWDE
jgi:hypothetical protein